LRASCGAIAPPRTLSSNPTASLQYVRRTLACRVGQTTPRLLGAINHQPEKHMEAAKKDSKDGKGKGGGKKGC